VSELLIGYARVSTDAQDLTAQRDAPTTLYVDHGDLLVIDEVDRLTPPALKRQARRLINGRSGVST
jgi:DNA invertase Pin-like site-specific DNA recombinase